MTSGKNKQGPPTKPNFIEKKQDEGDQQEPKICQFTGQIIVEKNPKFLGFDLIYIVAFVIVLLCLVISIGFLLIDNKTVRRQLLL